MNQVRKDVDMAARLEEIRLEGSAVKGEKFDLEAAALSYAKAFRDYGIDTDTLDPEDTAARVNVSEIREQLNVALDAWLLGTPPGSRKRLQAVLVRADADPWRQQLRAAFVEGDRKTLRALALQENASRQPPSAAALMGKALYDSNEVRAAVEFLRRAQQEHPGDFWLNQYLGSYLLTLGPANAAEPVGYLRVALAMRPDSPGVLTNLGEAMEIQGDLAGAVAALWKAIALKPDLAPAHRDLGYALRRQGDLAGAIVALQRANALKPDFFMAHLVLGQALEEQGDLHGAVAAYQKAIALKPDLAKQLQPDMVPARHYVRLSQWDKAAAEYAKAELTARPLSEDAFAFATLFLIRGDNGGYTASART
jgi:tetratricopeptide (TPR) repeat protein